MTSKELRDSFSEPATNALASSDKVVAAVVHAIGIRSFGIFGFDSCCAPVEGGGYLSRPTFLTCLDLLVEQANVRTNC